MTPVIPAEMLAAAVQWVVFLVTVAGSLTSLLLTGRG